MSVQRGPVARRRAGILLHPTSLPGPRENGDLGPDAHRFVDFLAEGGLSVWQTLPLGPTHDDGSPYQCLSAHAGNPRLVALEPLAEAGWLDGVPEPPGDREDAEAHTWKCLRSAHAGFLERADGAAWEAFDAFCREKAHWLEAYALFMALRGEGERPWWEWSAPLRDRRSDALEEAAGSRSGEMALHRFVQWQFFEQWRALKDYANERGILLFGDLPIFVAHDSAEVWAHRELFDLDQAGSTATVAGVPPDYFSETGQYWGNPHYRWDRIAADGYAWWIERMRTQLELFDWVRIDHFRGFVAFWEVPEGQPATEGRWVQGPGADFFRALEEALGDLPLVAEDLGVITPEVTGLRERFGLPGMKILQFAFGGGPDNPYLPHHHQRDFVVYTGTHDNNTTLGWWQEEVSGEVQEEVREYLGYPGEPVPWPLVRAALASVGRTAVVPMQDLLGLDGRHRMNQPATMEGNWQWRFRWEWVPEGLASRLARLNRLYDRT
ncbi:4-alpha-glucanotransferase [Thiohalorhabdus methylotrophus]|uniref:4-alpha-glucanotransferase n=1 Tax=Thiohalorhabdus methylotrophus TaxID=3242694 RepID=A0ABV4TYH3_9GAMM